MFFFHMHGCKYDTLVAHVFSLRKEKKGKNRQYDSIFKASLGDGEANAWRYCTVSAKVWEMWNKLEVPAHP